MGARSFGLLAMVAALGQLGLSIRPEVSIKNLHVVNLQTLSSSERTTRSVFEWVPKPECKKKAMLMDGCVSDVTTPDLSGWGAPREESADARAGEAVCCTAEGKAVRKFMADGQPSLNKSDPHRRCSTPNGKRLFEGDSPSYTFYEAKAICDKAGLRMCSTQAELETGCDTGCWFDTILVWVDIGEWVPKPECNEKAMLMDGCLPDKDAHLSGWGEPREESAYERAGEAICCTAEGKAVRHFMADGQPSLKSSDRKRKCSTPNGERLFEGDSPSYTFFEAKAICDKAGLRMCSTQAELDTACNSGCWFDTIMAWTE